MCHSPPARDGAALSAPETAIRGCTQQGAADGATAAQAGTAPQASAAAANLPAARDLERGLRRSPKYLPCRFLYDNHGSRLYEQITQLEEYYPYRAEQELLRQHAEAIAAHVPPGSVVAELGCGDCTKTSILLAALLRRHGQAGGQAGAGRDNSGGGGGGTGGPGGVGGGGGGDSGSGGGSNGIERERQQQQGGASPGPPPLCFCGVDVSEEALRQTGRSLARLLPELPQEQIELVAAEYLPGIAEVRARHPDAMLTILWLGSSVGNFSSSEAADFLAALRAAAGERCQLLLATDLWKDASVLRQAYDDSQGVSREFIVNGMRHALSTLGHPDAHCPDLWRYEPRVNSELQQVEMHVRATRRVADVLPGLHIEAGERVLVETSRKFKPESVAGMAFAAGLCPMATWANRLYSLQLLLPPALALERCWQDTDAIYACIRDWQAKPIALRHPWLFYYGHCASFAKVQLLPQEATSETDALFSRGIDPNVDDPNVVGHSHPPVPERWPERRELQAYAQQVRQQVLAAVGASASVGGGAGLQAPVAGGEAVADGMRRLTIALEHERMHQETLCYMAAQQRKADVAAAAAGQQAVLAFVAGDASQGQAADGAAGVVPFYLQQCSYACTGGASTALAARDGGGSGGNSPTLTGSPACGTCKEEAAEVRPSCGSTAAQHASPLEPATPTRAQAEGLPSRLAALHIGGSSGAHVAGANSKHSSAAETGSGAGKQGLGTDPFVHVPGGQVWLGVEPSQEELQRGFRWDCELGLLGPVAVPGMEVASGPVTVAQFRQFVFEEQGYSRRELWDPDAWRHLCASGHSMPATWSLLDASLDPAHPGPALAPTISLEANSCDGSSSHADGSSSGGGSGVHGIGGGARRQCPLHQGQQEPQLSVHMPEGSYRWQDVADCPVYVSLAEAQAYARLHGARLMTEAEWALAADSEAAATGGLRHLESGGWEWTCTPFEPLPGFHPDPLYPEFSADFFDGQHFVLRGASPYTHPSLARRSFRNFYQRLYPFAFAKFRLVRDGPDGQQVERQGRGTAAAGGGAAAEDGPGPA